ncbi:nuclear transport factor 2 family protein [Vibrio proteolyticus]|uniref:Putative transcriptional regulator n=1 Tax=Vibrio proteolyticus NBRC 13287 TaxID=1219065 RepID=U2ZYE1_VIBPR|nr:nuclear transport factor 2 family protein [Vibrio proteolyticus]GAD66117.1 putative transcriptional regulator [Vibrio proteolyticus NBRC 13287]
MDVETVGRVYNQLNKQTLHLLRDIYHEEVVFEDAAHRLHGLPALHDYFDSLYANVTRCEFSISDQQQIGDTGFLIWTMHLQHPKLQKGNPIQVNGVSHLRFSQHKVIYHRDYFDLGEMLYEHLPLLGAVIKTVKKRLGQ